VRDGGGGPGNHFGRQRIIGSLFVPEDAQDLPAGTIIEELHAVDAASEEFFCGNMARFVAAENLGHLAQSFNAIDDGRFVERMF
jgi:hypothetical protein